MLEVCDVSKSFGGVVAIDHCSFTIARGKVTALIGPNGAGKTTMFNAILGFVPIDSGKILYEGIDLTKKPSYEIASLGLVRTFQQVRVFKHLSIYDHLYMAQSQTDQNLFLNFFQKQDNFHTRFMQVLSDFGIDRSLDTLVSELSYGQKKLLQIAMALLQKHTMLFFDEPVAGVNSVVQARIEDLLLRLKKEGKTMVLIDHDMHFVRKLADHIIVMDAGMVLTEGKPDDVFAQKEVLDAYLGR